MFVLKFLRKFYKALSTDAEPAAIAFGVAFGTMAGFVPVTSRFGLVCIFLVLILRVQISSALLAWAIARAASMAGVALLFNPVGDALLTADGLRSFWTWSLNLPVVAWLELEYSAILGGAILGTALGALLFFPIRLLVIAYRRWVEEKLESSRFFKWMVNFWVIRLCRFVFVGNKM